MATEAGRWHHRRTVRVLPYSLPIQKDRFAGLNSVAPDKKSGRTRWPVLRSLQPRQRSVVTQLQLKFGQLLSDFVQRSHTEVLGGQQFVWRALNEFAKGRDGQSSHALAGTDGQVEIGDRSREHGLFLRRQIRSNKPETGGTDWTGERFFRLGGLQVLANLQAVRGHQVADFDQRRFAEVLPFQQIGLRDLGQVTEGHDIHAGETVAAADRQFEIGNRTAEQLSQPSFVASHIVVVVHLAGGFDVLHVHLGSLMIGIISQHAAEAECSGRVVALVFVQQAQVHQGAEVIRRAAESLFVQADGFVVVAVAGIFAGQAEQGLSMVRIHVDRAFEVFNRPVGIATIRQDTAHLVRVVGPAGTFQTGLLQRGFCLIEFALQPQRTGFLQRAFNRIVARLGGGGEVFFCFLRLVQRQLRQGEHVQRRAIVSSARQQSFGDRVLAQQVSADAGPNCGPGGSATFDITQDRFNFNTGLCDLIAGHCPPHLREFVGSDMPFITQDCSNVDGFHRLQHSRLAFRTGVQASNAPRPGGACASQAARPANSLLSTEAQIISERDQSATPWWILSSEPQRVATRRDFRSAAATFDFPSLAGQVMSLPEQWSRDELSAWQVSGLQTLLKTVETANPFWEYRLREAGVRSDSIRSLDDLRQIPLTTKQELAAEQVKFPPYGRNLTYPHTEYSRLHQTSGTTTGQPLRWLDTRASWNWLLDCWTIIYRLMRLRPDDRLCFPFSFGPFLGFWAGFEGALRQGNLCLAAGGMSSESRLKLIQDNQVTMLGCTPTYALRLAEVAADKGIDVAGGSVRAILVAGEPGGAIPSIRSRIEAAWGARVFDHWGMTEIGPLASEADDDPGNLTVLESACIAEILDSETGLPAAPGTPGELVVTNLGRLGSPVIRYRTGDIVISDPTPHPSGRHWLRLKGGIQGRTDDMLIVRGNNVFPASIEAIIREFDEITEFRIVVQRQREMNHIKLEIEPGPQVPETEVTTLGGRLAKVIKERLQFQAEVVVLPIQSLPRFEMKAKRLVRE